MSIKVFEKEVRMLSTIKQDCPVSGIGVRAHLVRTAALLVSMATFSCLASDPILIETSDFRLTVGTNAVVKSIVVKATGVEAVDASMDVPLCAAVQDRPFNNEIKLIQPNKRTVYPATGLRWDGDRLVASFEHRQYEAVLAVRKGAGYVAVELEDFRCDRKSTYDYLRMDIPPVASFKVLQIPVRNRKNFGDWLNAVWDETAAVAVVGTSPYPDIDHEKRGESKILFGEVFSGRKLRGAGAALIAAPGREAFLDAMDALERDYGLPRGVQSRRSQYLEEFIFHLSAGFSPKTLDETIAYAQKGGFRLVTFGMSHVTDEIGSWGRFGDYDLRKDFYPNGTNDLRKVLDRFHEAGIKVGLHTLHSHIGLKSRYVTPVADMRLNKTRRFTLAEALPSGTNDIASLAVLEPTADTVMYEPCRVLQFGGELLSYKSYTTEPPYRFLGVKRGAWNTTPTAHPRGEIGGILDISEFGTPMSCYLDQNTDLQDEVAAKIATYYNCGFDYIYLDGSEGVNRPFNYHVANGQYRLWKHLRPEPLFGEGAAKTHFGWHMLAGANAFDCFSPKIFKEKLREFPFKQAPFTWQDMSRVDFGWWGFWAPGSKDWWKETVGVQADMWEYGASVATAWKCAGSILMPLNELEKHKRVNDILETMRRWAEVRRAGGVKESWREELKRDYMQEHHLIKLADGSYDLVRYWQVTAGVGEDAGLPVRSFVFERDGYTWIVYWHAFAEGKMRLGLAADKVAVFDEFAGTPVPIRAVDGGVVIPADNRKYLRVALPRKTVVDAMQSATMQ